MIFYSKKMKTLISVCVLLLVLSICSCIALAGEKPKEEGVYIGFVIPQLGYPYWQALEIGAKDAARDLGIQFDFLAPAKADPQQQIAMVEGLIEKKVDGLVLLVNQAAQFISVINRAVDMGIPVICTNTDVEESKRPLYIGSNSYEAGKLQAKLLTEYLKKKGLSNQKVRLPIAECVFGDFTLNQRVKGFKEGIAGNPNIEIIGEFETDIDMAEAFNAMENIYAANPDMDVMYGTCAIDTRNAGTMKKRSGREDLIVFGHDLLLETLELIKEGYIQWTIGDNPYLQGYRPVEILYEHVTLGKPLPTGKIYVEAEVVTIDNVDKIYEREQKYYK